jgi:hypothetical protein
MELERNSNKILVKNPGTKGQLGRHTDKVEDSIKTDLKVERFEDMDFIRLSQDSVNLQATWYKALKFPTQ